jgi:hypothetical protein
MVKKGRRRLLALIAILVLAMVALSVFSRLQRRTGAAQSDKNDVTGQTLPEETLPWIRLARLNRAHDDRPRLERDVFEFGRPPVREVEQPPIIRQAPVKIDTPPPLPTRPTPIPLPPMSVRYIGAVETPQGLWFAALLTDKKELLTGKEGDIVANRYEIVKIGHESVDIRELASGQQRRIRLGGS